MHKRHPIGLRLTKTALRMLRKLSDETGVSQTGLLELLIRQEFDRRKLWLEDEEDDKN